MTPVLSCYDKSKCWLWKSSITAGEKHLLWHHRLSETRSANHIPHHSSNFNFNLSTHCMKLGPSLLKIQLMLKCLYFQHYPYIHIRFANSCIATKRSMSQLSCQGDYTIFVSCIWGENCIQCSHCRTVRGIFKRLLQFICFYTICCWLIYTQFKVLQLGSCNSSNGHGWWWWL